MGTRVVVSRMSHAFNRPWFSSRGGSIALQGRKEGRKEGKTQSLKVKKEDEPRRKFVLHFAAAASP